MQGLFVDCVAQDNTECIFRATRFATALGLTSASYEEHSTKGYLFLSFAQIARVRLVGAADGKLQSRKGPDDKAMSYLLSAPPELTVSSEAYGV